MCANEYADSGTVKRSVFFDLIKLVSQELPIGYSWQLLNFKGKGKIVFITF